MKARNCQCNKAKSCEQSQSYTAEAQACFRALEAVRFSVFKYTFRGVLELPKCGQCIDVKALTKLVQVTRNVL